MNNAQLMQMHAEHIRQSLIIIMPLNTNTKINNQKPHVPQADHLTHATNDWLAIHRMSLDWAHHKHCRTYG